MAGRPRAALPAASAEAGRLTSKLLRRVLVAVVASVIVVAGGFALLASGTSYTERPLAYKGRPGDPVPPAWTRPCWRRKQEAYVLPCGRVQGVIVYREDQDPDGDGDAHGVAVAGWRLVILKARPSVPGSAAIPGAGHHVDLAGTVTRGRAGLTVIDVRRSGGARR